MIPSVPEHRNPQSASSHLDRRHRHAHLLRQRLVEHRTKQPQFLRSPMMPWRVRPNAQLLPLPLHRPPMQSDDLGDLRIRDAAQQAKPLPRPAPGLYVLYGEFQSFDALGQCGIGKLQHILAKSLLVGIRYEVPFKRHVEPD